jgi:hypothetical protein
MVNRMSTRSIPIDARTHARALTLVVAAGLAVSAIIHGALIGEHLEEAWQFGAFFIASTAALAVLAVAVVAAPTRGVFVASLVVSLLMIATWALFRIVPPPFGEGVEEVDAIGLWCKAAEVVAAAGCVALLRAPRTRV